MRALAAGGTAAAALIAAAALVLVSLAAYLAFNDIPAGGGEARAGSVAIDSPATLDGAPEDAARVLAQAPAAVAATPAAPAPVASATAGALAGAPGAGGPTNGPGSREPVVNGGPASVPADEPRIEPGPEPGLIGGRVAEIERVTDPVVDTPLTEATDDVTVPLDAAIAETLDALDATLGTVLPRDQQR